MPGRGPQCGQSGSHTGLSQAYDVTDTSWGVQTSSCEKGPWIKEQHLVVSEVALTSSSGH